MREEWAKWFKRNRLAISSCFYGGLGAALVPAAVIELIVGNFWWCQLASFCAGANFVYALIQAQRYAWTRITLYFR